jgi:hypothetical protein
MEYQKFSNSNYLSKYVFKNSLINESENKYKMIIE